MRTRYKHISDADIGYVIDKYLKARESYICGGEDGKERRKKHFAMLANELRMRGEIRRIEK